MDHDRKAQQNQIKALIELYQQGHLQKVIESGTALAKQYPDEPGILNLLGTVYSDLGHKEAAIASFRQALKVDPDNAVTHYNFASTLMRLGQVEEAVIHCRRTLELKPGFAEAHDRLGTALHRLGRHEEAIASFIEALQLNPGYAGAYNNLGNALMDTGDIAAAITNYERALQVKPDYAEAYINLGTACMDSGKSEQALDCFRKALQIWPDSAVVYFNMGAVLMALGKPGEAIASYHKALQIRPRYAEAYYNLGNAQKKLGQFKESVISFRRALEIKPDIAEVHNNLGSVLMNLGRYEEAINSYRRALQIRSDSARTYKNLGVALMCAGQAAEAITSYHQALQLNPDYSEVHNYLCYALADSGSREETNDGFQQADRTEHDDLSAYGSFPHQIAYLCDWTQIEAPVRVDLNSLKFGTASGEVVNPFTLPAFLDDAGFQRRVAEAYIHAVNLPDTDPGPFRARHSGDRIRIGYFSADFHNHATMYLMAGLFELHDRTRFEIHVFSFGPDKQDAMRNRLLNSVEMFHDVRGQDDHEVAALSRSLGIDIAVDLKGYTPLARPGIFACRAAPVQVNYLGYPGTMGAPFIDYIIADEVLIPPQSRQYYSEKVVYLPDSYQVNDSNRDFPGRTYARTDFGLPETAFVYCCFNNSFKITPEVFAIWMNLLDQVPGSVLWLLKFHGMEVHILRRAAMRRGIDPERLIFAEMMPLAEHLPRYRLANLFVDTFNYNAHTTTSDALWMGLPVVTKLGQSFAGRVAGSLLHAMGLPELVTTTATDYEALALRLTLDPEALKAVSDKLAASRKTAPLFDTARLTGHLESAYSEMIRRLDGSPGPQHFHV